MSTAVCPAAAADPTFLNVFLFPHRLASGDFLNLGVNRITDPSGVASVVATPSQPGLGTITFVLVGNGAFAGLWGRQVPLPAGIQAGTTYTVTATNTLNVTNSAATPPLVPLPADLTIPQNVTVRNSGGHLVVSWDRMILSTGEASAYDVAVVVGNTTTYQSPNISPPPPGPARVTFTLPDGAATPGQGVLVRVHAVLLAGGVKTGQSQTDVALAVPPPDLIQPPASPPSSVESLSGSVTVKTPLGSQAASAGASVGSGSLLQTGADGTITVAFQGGTRLTVAPNSQVTVLPPLRAGADDVQLNQVRGSLTHAVVSATPFVPDLYRVRTPVAVVQPTGTSFITQFAEVASHAGQLQVSVQQGRVEVAPRVAQLATLLAGQQTTVSDTVPRVTGILPVDRGSVVAGVVNTFSWTAFTGAAGYLFEFTVSGSGFTTVNPPGPEAASSRFLIGAGGFTETAGTVELPVLVPATGIPLGLRVQWRIFPTDGSGALLAGSLGSDASSVFVIGRSVQLTAPPAGGAVAQGATTTFSWTSFAGAAGYLLEYTTSPSGFAQANAAAPEAIQTTLRLGAGAYADAGGTVRLLVPVPMGAAPPGTRLQWRVFPTDAAGQVLPGAAGSDARSFVLQ